MSDAQDRSQAPSPRRHAQAVRQGHAPRPRELYELLTVVALVLLWSISAGHLWAVLTQLVEEAATWGAKPGLEDEAAQEMAVAVATTGVGAVAMVVLSALLVRTVLSKALGEWRPRPSGSSSAGALAGFVPGEGLGTRAWGCFVALLAWCAGAWAAVRVAFPGLVGGEFSREGEGLPHWAWLVCVGALLMWMCQFMAAIGTLWWRQRRFMKALRTTRAEREREERESEGDVHMRRERRGIHAALVRGGEGGRPSGAGGSRARGDPVSRETGAE